MMDIQLNDNVKARILDNELNNQYVSADRPGYKRATGSRGSAGMTADKTASDSAPLKIRSQLEIYQYLQQKAAMALPPSGNNRRKQPMTKENQGLPDHILKTNIDE